MLQAKRAIEAVIETGSASIDLPTVEEPSMLVGELRVAGFHAAVVQRRVASVSPASIEAAAEG